jgi:dTDP-glucose 4,6-dehydratase
MNKMSDENSVKQDDENHREGTILVTGGCGFIGSNFIRYILENTIYKVINYDALTYAGNKENLKDLNGNPRYKFVIGDVCDKSLVLETMKECDMVVHFAAESHVDRSIEDSKAFIQTNFVGTSVLLEAAREIGVKKFLQIGTDEVYGSLSMDDPSSVETDNLDPRSPYSSSKAAADLLALSYFHTYDLPVVVSRSSNNYGPYQFPEKLIPLFITNLIESKKVPLMGKGENIRDWLYVEDNCAGLLVILEKGKDGEIYNVGGDNEKTNMQITNTILTGMGKDETWIKPIPHRLGHDFRYSLSSKKTIALGWKSKYNFEEGMKKTIQWYIKNDTWWRKLK